MVEFSITVPLTDFTIMVPYVSKITYVYVIQFLLITVPERLYGRRPRFISSGFLVDNNRQTYHIYIQSKKEHLVCGVCELF